MNQQMNWEEIVSNHPNEWVALADYEEKDAVEITGTIIAHHRNKKVFHQKVRKLMFQHHDIAVRFTGQLIKNPEIPLLWQITHTD